MAKQYTKGVSHSALYPTKGEPIPYGNSISSTGHSVQAMVSETERAMDWQLYEYHLRKLAGQVLTVADVLGDTKQGKAIKDLIKARFSERLSVAYKFFFDGVCEHTTKPELYTEFSADA